MRRGFTLVELAIVLVIIGLIMGMAIKGRQLIHVAKVQADLSKLRKQEVALNIYYGKYERMPTAVTSGGAVRLDTKELSDIGLLQPDDLVPSYIAPSHHWVFVRASFVNWNSVQYYKHDLNGSFVLSQPVGPLPDEQGNRIPLKLLCYVELKLDDQNMADGTGRYSAARDSNPNPPTDMLPAYYDDCEKVPSSAVYDSYTYRIF